MNRYLALTWALLKSSYSPLATGKRAKIKSIAIFILILLSIAPLATVLAVITSKLYPPLAAISQEGVLLALACGVTSLLILFFGIFYVINVFYFAQDVAYLLPLPLRPWQILTSKFSVTLIFEYLSQSFLLLPILITFGMKSAATANYYLIALFIFILLPIMPLIFASAISMLIMSLIPAGRYKDALRILGGLIGLFVALAFNYYWQRLANAGNEGDVLQALQSGGNSLVDVLAHLFPGLKWMVAALLQQGALAGWGWLLLYLGVVGLSLTLFFAIGERVYFRGVLSGSETYAGRQRLDTRALAGGSSPLRPLWSLVLKEWRILWRTPAFFMNCVIINFLWPVMLLFTNATTSGKSIVAARAFFQQQPSVDLLLLIGLGMGLFIAGTNATSASGISRDGAQFFIMKLIPIDYWLQIRAKMMMAFLLSSIGFLVFLILLAIWLKLAIASIASLLAGSFIGMAFSTATGMLIDIHFPKLVWDNEYRAVKQNVGVMVNVFLGFGLAALAIFLAFKFKASRWMRTVTVFGFFLLANAMLYHILQRHASRWMEKIEV